MVDFIFRYYSIRLLLVLIFVLWGLGRVDSDDRTISFSQCDFLTPILRNEPFSLQYAKRDIIAFSIESTLKAIVIWMAFFFEFFVTVSGYNFIAQELFPTSYKAM